MPFPTWAIRPDGPIAGELLRGGLRMRLEGLRMRPGGARVALGEHRMVETARALGVTGPALCTITASRLSGSLGSWTSVELPADPVYSSPMATRT